MKNLYIKSFALFIVLFISSTLIDAQQLGVVGKLYSKADADSIYGHVLKSEAIQTALLTTYASKTPSYIMFSFVNGKVCVLDSARTVLTPTPVTIGPKQEFRVASTSQLLALLQQGGSDVTTVEVRESALTISNGAMTMEEITPCPPFCP